MFTWSENELLLLEKATLCEYFLTFSKRTIQNFPLLSNRLMEVFVSISGGFPSQLTPENDCFLFVKALLTAGKQICLINLNVFPELGRFSEGETFYQIATAYVKVVATD